MKAKYFIFLVIAFVVMIGIFEGWPAKILDSFKDSRLLSYVSEREELLPGPLRGSFDAFTGNLTRDGVVEWTNKQRIQYGQSELRANPKLNVAAEAKLQDMFNKQYFEHVSPDGLNPSDVVKNAQYAYLVVGENLAMGNFKDDEALVLAWMNSPGHRENILHAKYQEIGVAVRKGSFEGKEVWMAVQEFGTPLSSCPSPSVGMKQEIESNKERLNYLQELLNTQKTEIESTKYSSNEEYNKAVEQFNELVKQFNELNEKNKAVVEQYNVEVNAFNLCLEKNG